jgi:hypothetical protein
MSWCSRCPNWGEQFLLTRREVDVGVVVDQCVVRALENAQQQLVRLGIKAALELGQVEPELLGALQESVFVHGGIVADPRLRYGGVSGDRLSFLGWT